MSSSSNSDRLMEYEVFISFRGPDVRNSFADYIYQFLDNYGIRAFLDNEELRKGEKCAPEIIKAIEESKVYVPILSPGYASSKWCLWEVAHIVKCCKQEKGHIILPVFYFMEPRDVRHQKGSYEEAFHQHNDNEKYCEEIVNEWREALKEVGQIEGWEVNQSERQGAIVRQVFSRIRSYLMESYLLVTEKLVGIDPHVQQVINLLNKSVKVVGIVGMGGIGKSTIAMAVRDQVVTKFDRCCFLQNVQETLSKKGIVALQKKILFAILNQDENVQEASQGIRLIKDRVCKFKVLIIIDDIDEKFEFQEIIGNLEDFSAASRFIITTRNKRVLEFFQHELYKPKGLDDNHSLQLFSKHAFGMSYPPEDLVALSIEFVEVASGLPLALKVIGSALNRKNETFWKAKLKQLKRIPHHEVLQRLMISYVDLTREEQQIFLDISCFFIGKHKAQPIYMWDDCDFSPEIGVDTLILKSLITVEGDIFLMHDSLRDLGRYIIRLEDPESPWNCSRIWSAEDAIDILTNEKGGDRLECLRVDNFLLTDRQLEKLHRLRYLKVVGGGVKGSVIGILRNIRWLQFYACSSIPVDLNMKNLVNFNLHCCHINDEWRGWKRLKDAQKLKSISMTDCNGIKTAPNFSKCRNLELMRIVGCVEMLMSGELHIGNLDSLQVLHLISTYYTEVSHDFRKVTSSEQLKLKEAPALPTSLKELYISYPSIPNLLDLKNLEVLSFYDCDAPEIPGDIWKLSKLKSMTMLMASRISELVVEEAGNAIVTLPSSLKALEINDCFRLERLPNLSNLGNLTELLLYKTRVRQIVGLGEMRKLECLQILYNSSLVDLDGLENLKLLEILRLAKCSVLEKLPSLSNLTKLQELDIYECPSLPDVIGSGEQEEPLSNLIITGRPHLNLKRPECWRPVEPLLPFLSNLDNLSSLEYAENGGYPLLAREPFIDLSRLQNLQFLSMSGCQWVTELGGFERLELLEYLCIVEFKSLRKLSNLYGLKKLRKLEILGCMQLTEVIGLEYLESLEELRMCHCNSITKLPDLSCLRHLWSLEIRGCTQLTEITGIERLVGTDSLWVDESIRIVPSESSRH